jgi:hypothetical protein
VRLPSHRSVVAPAQRQRWKLAAAPIAGAALVVALAACARKDMKSEMDRTRSWVETMKLARELRGIGATNGAVTAQLLQRATRAHGKEAHEFAKLATSDSQRTAARGLLDSLQHEIVKLQQVPR